MNTDSWILMTDKGRVGGMLAAARHLGGRVTVAVVGPRSLAEAAAAAGPDRVLWFAVAEGLPTEAYAGLVAEAAKAEAPRVVLASDAPSGRVLLGLAAAGLGAAIVSSVRALAMEGETILVSRPTAEGRAVQTLEATGTLACLFDGEDVEPASAPAVAIEAVPPADPGDALRLVEFRAASADSAGLLTAARVVGAGLGLRAKDDLKLIEDLAAAARAEIACSLPVCDDMRWFDSNRVVGSSHNQIAPDLYIAVGISGQPQHMSGVRDAKVVVAINSDPDARIFKNCDYGILGDLYKVVPALTAALREA
ncbi:MAG: electron transfer flavoprotein subunit alpha/FixB family protein [Holophaga sp.]|nr:electron transfer flavoprotein subunit alpha/FixB family protein [Holophaga sp.]